MTPPEPTANGIDPNHSSFTLFNPVTSPAANPLSHWCIGLPTTGPLMVRVKPFDTITPGLIGMIDTDAGIMVLAVMILSSTVTLTANTIIPASVSIMPINPGVIVSNGFTLTINGPVVGNPMYQWLSGFAAGEVTFSIGAIKKVYSEWFGAISNDSVNCSTAIYAAIKSVEDI